MPWRQAAAFYRVSEELMTLMHIREVSMHSWCMDRAKRAWTVRQPQHCAAFPADRAGTKYFCH